MTVLKVRVEYTDEILGTAANNKEIHSEYIGGKAPDAPSRTEEIAAVGVEEIVNKEMTVFSRDEDGNPILWDYQWKGFLKEAMSAIRTLVDKEGDTGDDGDGDTDKDSDTGKKKAVGKKKSITTASGQITAYKSKIDKNIFVWPRKIPFTEFDKIGNCQRPLRAETAQGPRIALANSETIPAGAKQEFEILCMDDSHVNAVVECLFYGLFKGTGQWRNSGKGRFDFVEIGERESLSTKMMMDPEFRTKWRGVPLSVN